MFVVASCLPFASVLSDGCAFTLLSLISTLPLLSLISTLPLLAPLCRRAPITSVELSEKSKSEVEDASVQHSRATDRSADVITRFFENKQRFFWNSIFENSKPGNVTTSHRHTHHVH